MSIQTNDTIIYCIDNVTCHSACDGKVIVDVRGSNGPYIFEWNSDSVSTPVIGDNVRDSLCAGSFSVTISNSSGNLVSFISNQITEPSSLGIFNVINEPTCFNFSDGSINITTLGDSPFQWKWSTGDLSEDINSLSSGLYTLETTDNNGCIRLDTFVLNNPLEFLSQVNYDTISCIGVCDASASSTTINGSFPFIYNWDNNSQNNDTAFNLCYGLHELIITDSNGCSDTNNFFISNPDTLKLKSIIVDSACFEICDGSIDVIISGGISPYNTYWYQNLVLLDSSKTSINSLCPDIYTISFSDANNCIQTENILLSERDSFLINASIIDDSCFNSCKGSINVTILDSLNHVPPFIYNWSNGSLSNISKNLCADTLDLEIIDSRLCRDTFQFIITEPEKISIDSFLIINPKCFGDSTGAIYVNISGGVGLLESIWNDQNGFISNSSDLVNLVSGFYNLSVNDENLCNLDTVFSITSPNSLSVSESIENVSCFSYSNGKINLTISGGILPYNITWDLIISDSSFVDSLTAGNYIYTILDSNLCFVSDTAIVNQPDEIIILDSITHVLCYGESKGIIDLSTFGGFPPYTYLWNDSSTNQDLVNIPAGTYSVLVKDFKNCPTNMLYTVNQPFFPITSSIIGKDLTCFGSLNGSANLTVAGGTNPYSFVWSTADSTEDIFNLSSGTYSVYIKDNNGCDTTNQIIISEPQKLIINESINHLSCFKDSSGSIDILISGGILPYTILWDNGEVTYNINNLIAGTYNVSVSDDSLCTINKSIIVTQPDKLSTSHITNPLSCYNINDGSIDLTVSGGSKPYIYTWSNGINTQDLNNLSKGLYSVVVVDSNLCIDSLSIFVNSPQQLYIDSFFVKDILCFGESTGQINLFSVSGGTGSYTYSWSDGSNNQDLSNSKAGLYNLKITDFNNCDRDYNFIINEPNAPFLETSSIKNVSCFSGDDGQINFSITGNTPPYSFLWNNNIINSSIFNLSSGIYEVRVTDVNGCEIIYNYLVEEPEEILINETVINSSCEEKNDGAIYTNVSGGTAPYLYNWDNGSEDQQILNLSPGNYILDISDANGCSYLPKVISVSFDGFDGCIEIPSGFTPNGDGIHDEWTIYGLYNFSDVLVKVYNRWGQEIFTSNGYSVPWDGKYNGVDLPMAAYYYIIEIKSSNKIFNGTVTIKR